MKSLTAITGPDAPSYNPSLKERLMRGTAARLCPEIGIVSTTPVIMTGSDMVSPAQDLRGRMAKILGPLYVVYLYMLRLFGLCGLAGDKLAEIDAIYEEAGRLSETALYWQRATERLVARVAQARQLKKPYTIPDWFIWLGRFDVSISPARLKAIMAACSLMGRVAVYNLVTSVIGAGRAQAMSPRNTMGAGALSGPIMPRCRDPVLCLE